MPKSFVFKVERAQIPFEAQLSNGKSVNLTYLAPNARQAKELQTLISKGDEIGALEKSVRECVIGDNASEFVDDLLENGSVGDFVVAMTSELASVRKAKTKN